MERKVKPCNIRKLTDSRKKHIKARISDYDLKTFFKMIDIVSKSNFLQGKNNRKWAADFDWVVNPTNFTKIVEEKYTNENMKSYGKKTSYDKEDVEIDWLDKYLDEEEE